MDAIDLLSSPAHFAPALLRVVGMLAVAPLIGSTLIPRRVKLLIASVLTLAMASAMPEPRWPESDWHLALGLAGELLLGMALGLVLSLVFIAARLAGSLAGQQMGFDLAGSIDPSAGAGGNPLGDAYYLFAAFLFLLADGHHAMMLGLRNSFEYVPPLAVALDGQVADVLAGMLMSATALAVRVAAPVCVAVLAVDLVLGMIGRTIPGLSLMSVGLSLRAVAGLMIVILGLGLTATVLTGAINDGLSLAEGLWRPPPP